LLGYDEIVWCILEMRFVNSIYEVANVFQEFLVVVFLEDKTIFRRAQRTPERLPVEIDELVIELDVMMWAIRVEVAVTIVLIVTPKHSASIQEMESGLSSIAMLLDKKKDEGEE